MKNPLVGDFSGESTAKVLERYQTRSEPRPASAGNQFLASLLGPPIL
jgi:hypothetical protein